MSVLMMRFCLVIPSGYHSIQPGCLMNVIRSGTIPGECVSSILKNHSEIRGFYGVQQTLIRDFQRVTRAPDACSAFSRWATVCQVLFFHWESKGNEQGNQMTTCAGFGRLESQIENRPALISEERTSCDYT